MCVVSPVLKLPEYTTSQFPIPNCPFFRPPFNELDDAEIVQKEDFAAFLSSLNTEIFSEASELTKLECLQALTEKVKKLLPHAVANLHPGRTIVFLQFVVMCLKQFHACRQHCNLFGCFPRRCNTSTGSLCAIWRSGCWTTLQTRQRR